MILVRHAESAWNALYGQTQVDPGIEDPPLTPRGRSQAEAVARQLAEAGVCHLISSPYRRALETATIVAAQAPASITIEPLVRERSAFSCDVGTPRSGLERAWPDLDFSLLDEIWWTAEGESLADLRRRAEAFRTLSGSLPNRSAVAVISHWGFIRALTGHAVDNAVCVHLT